MSPSRTMGLKSQNSATVGGGGLRINVLGLYACGPSVFEGCPYFQTISSVCFFISAKNSVFSMRSSLVCQLGPLLSTMGFSSTAMGQIRLKMHHRRQSGVLQTSPPPNLAHGSRGTRRMTSITTSLSLDFSVGHAWFEVVLFTKRANEMYRHA